MFEDLVNDAVKMNKFLDSKLEELKGCQKQDPETARYLMTLEGVLQMAAAKAAELRLRFVEVLM